MADWYFRDRQSGIIACPSCRNLVKRAEKYCPYCAYKLQGDSGLSTWWKNFAKKGFPVSRLLLGFIIAMFFFQYLSNFFLPLECRLETGYGRTNPGVFEVSSTTYIRLGSNFHPFVRYYGEVWRFVTYCFLHIGILHILFNGMAMWQLCPFVEKLWGARRTFVGFILTGAAGGAASFVWNALVLGTGSNSAGASGAICGLLGMLLGAYYRSRYQIGEQLGQILKRWAIMVLAFGILVGADNGAHVGGLLSGIALGYYVRPIALGPVSAAKETVWKWLTIFTFALTLVCFGFMVVFYLHGPYEVIRLLTMLKR